MAIVLRPGTPADAVPCGVICYDAFLTISTAHGFPPDFPSPELAVSVLRSMLSHPQFYAVVAEQDGRAIGSNFIDLRNPVAGIGPITVDPVVQNRAVGRQLMEDVCRHAQQRGFERIRLVQAAFHNRSLALYAKLGFDVREPLACMQGAPLGLAIPGCTVRPATPEDVEACHRVCISVHGHDRGGELRDAVKHGAARAVERDGRITGYTTGIAFFGHAVGEQVQDLQALIGAAELFGGPGFLLPTRNNELFRWCLENGLRVVQPLTLMSRGPYQDPVGAFLPSITY